MPVITWEAETRESEVSGQPGLYSETTKTNNVEVMR
jgi:hypothetical protein